MRPATLRNLDPKQHAAKQPLCTRQALPSPHHKQLPRPLTGSAPSLASLVMYAHLLLPNTVPLTFSATLQVALQEGDYGRGMMLTAPVQSGTSAAPGVACSVPLHLSLVLVKKKEMFSRGPLDWHERYALQRIQHTAHYIAHTALTHHIAHRYLQNWQSQMNATLPESLLRVLRSEKENDLLRFAEHVHTMTLHRLQHTQPPPITTHTNPTLPPPG